VKINWPCYRCAREIASTVLPYANVLYVVCKACAIFYIQQIAERSVDGD
jgi:hypothetical protein